MRWLRPRSYQRRSAPPLAHEGVGRSLQSADMARRASGRLPRPSGRRRWTSFVADTVEPAQRARGLHEEANAAHRLRVEHDDHTLLIHLSDEDGRGWTTFAIDRPNASVGRGPVSAPDRCRAAGLRNPVRALTRGFPGSQGITGTRKKPADQVGVRRGGAGGGGSVPGTPSSTMCSVHSVPDQYRWAWRPVGSVNQPGASPEPEGGAAAAPSSRRGPGWGPGAGCGEGVARGPLPLTAVPPALRGEDPYQQDGAEDHQSDPRAMPVVVHVRSVRPASEDRSAAGRDRPVPRSVCRGWHWSAPSTGETGRNRPAPASPAVAPGRAVPVALTENPIFIGGLSSVVIGDPRE